MDLSFALEGFFFEKVNRSLSLSTILYMHQPHATQLQGAFCWLCGSLIRRLLLLHLNGISRWTSQLLLRGSFSKRSMGRRVKRVTFAFTILYMIADDARLTPPRCKKHTGSTGHFHFHYIIYDSRRRKAHATPLHKAHGV